MSTSGSKSNEHVAHFLVDIHKFSSQQSSLLHIFTAMASRNEVPIHCHTTAHSFALLNNYGNGIIYTNLGGYMSIKVTKHSIDKETRSVISGRYKRITRAINRSFWNSESETEHSMYVGSYGRGTAINTSDLDVLFILPESEYNHFNSLNGNGPSRLLQAVKDALLATYPLTKIKGDGQIVSVDFSDGIRFEILPAFKRMSLWGWDGTYIYPDTHMGGNWLSTNPRAEIDAMNKKDAENSTNKLLTATCQHIRYIRDKYFSSYHLSGILIDSFVYNHIGGWHFTRQGEDATRSINTFEEHLLNEYNRVSFNGLITPNILAPGSGMPVDASKGWEVLGKILRKMV